MLDNPTMILRKMPPPAARLAKQILTYPRFWRCRATARKYHKSRRNESGPDLVFIAAMPKSGSTWLETVVASYGTYQPILLPDITFHELRTGTGHTYQLPEDYFDRFARQRVITKLHLPGSIHNSRIISKRGLPYIILIRDLRDVTISHYHYARQTPWHADYHELRRACVNEGIDFFIEKRLQEFSDWAMSWSQNREPSLSLLVKYEDLRSNPSVNFSKILCFLGLEVIENRYAKTIQAHTLGKMRSDNKAASYFFRDGTVAKWRKHYTPSQKEAFKELAGQTLINLGYETNADW